MNVCNHGEHYETPCIRLHRMRRRISSVVGQVLDFQWASLTSKNCVLSFSLLRPFVTCNLTCQYTRVSDRMKDIGILLHSCIGYFILLEGAGFKRRTQWFLVNEMYCVYFLFLFIVQVGGAVTNLMHTFRRPVLHCPGKLSKIRHGLFLLNPFKFIKHVRIAFDAK